MEKKSLSQQTADRLYTMIVVERRLSPGEKLPSELGTVTGAGRQPHHPARGHPRPGIPENFRGPPGPGHLRRRRSRPGQRLRLF